MGEGMSPRKEAVLENYLQELEKAELSALQSVFPSLTYGSMLSVRSLSQEAQWELSLPYSRQDASVEASVGRGNYTERNTLKSKLDSSPLKVYEISVNLSRSVAELHNLGVLGESFYVEELKGAFKKTLSKAQLMAEKGLEGEKGLFNFDAAAAGCNVTTKAKHVLDYALTDLGGVKTLLEQIRSWANVVATETGFGAKVDTLAAPLNLGSTVFESLLNLGGTLTTLKQILKDQLGVNVVYALNSDDVNRIVLYAKDAVEMFDAMRLRVFTNTCFEDGLEYLTQLRGANLEVPVAMRISPMVVKEAKAIHVVDMSAPAKP